MSIHTLEPAYHPNQKMTMLIDWLVTLKCNYDCAYCPIGPDGHDNSTQHPPYDVCIKMLEQMYQYTDVVMSYKKETFKDAILNIYGGESVYHPRILDIMSETSRRYEKYKDNWRLKRRLTTNGTASAKNWKILCDHIEGVTMSYHSPGPAKLKTVFKNNIEHLVDIKMEHDVVVLMYPQKDFWQDCVEFMRWSKANKVNARAKMLDGPFHYRENHLEDLKEFIDPSELKDWDTSTKPDNQSRGCCGGRKMCSNRNIKEYSMLVPRGPQGFVGWQCSANQFFLHGNNVTEQYYTNKDCKVKLDGTRGAIADINTMPDYIESMKGLAQLPTLRCVQRECLCGTCAPKSSDPQKLKEILGIYNL